MARESSPKTISSTGGGGGGSVIKQNDKQINFKQNIPS